MKTIILPVCFATATLLPTIGSAQVDPLPGYASGIEVRRAYVMDRALDSVNNSHHEGSALRGKYLESSIDQEAERDTEGYGAGVAYGWRFPQIFWEMSVDYQDLVSDFDLKTGDRGRGDIETSSVTFALAGELEIERWRFFAQGGYGVSDYEARRVTVTGRKDAEYEGDDWFALVRLDRTFATDGGWLIRPFVGASGSWVKTETAVERAAGPAGADARIIFGDDYEETLAFGGISFEVEGDHFRPILSAAWVEPLNSGDFTFDRVDMRSGGARPNEEEVVERPYDGFWVIDLRLPIAVSDTGTLAPGIRYAEGDEETRWQAGASLNFRY